MFETPHVSPENIDYPGPEEGAADDFAPNATMHDGYIDTGIYPEEDLAPPTGEADTAYAHGYDEVPATGNVDAYFNKYMLHPSDQLEEAGVEKLARYKDLVSKTATDLFGGDILAGDRGSDGRHSAVRELTSIVVSLDHNAGVYYAEEDIEGIFSTVAREFFDDTTKQQLDEAEPQGPWATSSIINARAEAVSSVDTETALPLVKDASGAWKVAGPQEYGQDGDFSPLEILRQDNNDKGGWDKYRFRQPTYSRQPDDLHAKEVADGWYTSDWQREPNYWSAHLRSAIAEATYTAGEQLADTGATIVAETEGGIFKGTSTAGTDLDTVGHITCSSPADFEPAYQAANQAFAGTIQRLPFGVKDRDNDVTFSFYDHSTGENYHRWEDGTYTISAREQLEDGQIIKTVRNNEKGIIVTTPAGMELFKKPPEFNGKTEYVGIAAESGEIRPLPNRMYTPPAHHANLAYGGEMDIV